LAAGGPGAPASASTSFEGESSTFGALISVLVGPASEAGDGGGPNQGGQANEISAEQSGDVLEAVDAMAAEAPLPFVLAPTDTTVAPLSLPTPAMLGGILGEGAEISGVAPEPVLVEARATEEPSSNGDSYFESPSIRSVRGDASRWSAHSALPSANGRIVVRGMESGVGGHGKPSALAAGARGAADSTALADVRAPLDGIGLAASEALWGWTEPQAPSATPTTMAAVADTATGTVQGPIAPNTVLSGPAFHLQPGNDPAAAADHAAAPLDHTAAPVGHQRAAAALDLSSAPFDDAAAAGQLGETTRASAPAAQPAALPAASSESPGLEVDAGDRVLREEPGDQGVARPTSAATVGALTAATDERSSDGDSHRGDRKGFAAAQLRDLVADRTAVRADLPGDAQAWSVAAGAATARDAATDPIVTPRVEVSSVSEELLPSLVPAASPWATAEPAALESGLGGAHANQRFTSMLAHAEEFHGPEHVSKQVVRALYLQWRGGVGEAHVQLNPEHLGQVTLSLRVEQGNVAATVVAETETAQRWIESHRDSLQQSLGEQGLKLDRLMVTTSREGRREQAPDAQGQRQRRPSPRRTSQGVFEVRV
jgi:flagellar hook-length control protein FliK